MITIYPLYVQKIIKAEKEKLINQIPSVLNNLDKNGYEFVVDLSSLPFCNPNQEMPDIKFFYQKTLEINSNIDHLYFIQVRYLIISNGGAVDPEIFIKVSLKTQNNNQYDKSTLELDIVRDYRSFSIEDCESIIIKAIFDLHGSKMRDK